MFSLDCCGFCFEPPVGGYETAIYKSLPAIFSCCCLRDGFLPVRMIDGFEEDCARLCYRIWLLTYCLGLWSGIAPKLSCM